MKPIVGPITEFVFQIFLEGAHIKVDFWLILKNSEIIWKFNINEIPKISNNSSEHSLIREKMALNRKKMERKNNLQYAAAESRTILYLALI